MKRWLLPSVFFLSLHSLAQPFTLQTGASMTVEPGAIVYFSNEATLAGVLNNQGSFLLNKHIDFGSNTSAGSLKFVGSGEQVLRAETLKANDFALDKQGGLMLEANRLEISGTLELSQGLLFTRQASVVLTSGHIAGGSPQSYINGGLTQIAGTSPLFFPMGLNGHYNSLSLPDIGAGKRLNVQIAQPEAGKLIPGDSLLGLADEVAWIITNEGGGTLSSVVELDFEGIDLSALPNPQTIRAYRYGPVPAYLDSAGGKYRQLGIGLLEDTDSISYGWLTSARPLIIDDKPRHVSIGRMPLSAGPRFYVPNIFSPNAINEENRVFRPFLGGVQIDEIQMTVWDAFNKPMYSISQPNPELDQLGWDGKLDSGITASEGVYYFMILLKTKSGTFEKKGSFILLR